jgi:hypothetical protein
MTAYEWVLTHYLAPDAHDDWPFSTTVKGYAQTHRGYAHSIACALAHGPRPSGLQALHSCRNRHCYWAEHLYWGTPQRNQIDRLRDGTDNRGIKHGMHKLTEADVLTIRQRSNESRASLAKEFGVSHRNIRRILNRETWDWLYHQ